MRIADWTGARRDRIGKDARSQLETVSVDDLRHNLDVAQQRFGEFGRFRWQMRH